MRVVVETLAAVMGGAQSVFTCAFAEAFQIPTEFSAEIALRTQQIVAYESGVAVSVFLEAPRPQCDAPLVIHGGGNVRVTADVDADEIHSVHLVVQRPGASKPMPVLTLVNAARRREPIRQDTVQAPRIGRGRRSQK